MESLTASCLAIDSGIVKVYSLAGFKPASAIQVYFFAPLCHTLPSSQPPQCAASVCTARVQPSDRGVGLTRPARLWACWGDTYSFFLGEVTMEKTSYRLPAIVLPLLLIWAYFPTLVAMVQKWATDPQYSHGFLVPLFSAYLIYRRLHTEADLPARSCGGDWAVPLGLCLLGLSAVLRVLAALLYLQFFDALSLLPCILGMITLLGGRQWFARSWAAVLFLFFMLPLPYRAELFLGYPLQRIATMGSTFLLQTLSFPAIAEGNTILLNDVKLGIVEQCSGLRMLMTFFAFSVATTLIIERSWLIKLFVVVSAVPIAIVTNILRITGTGWAFTYFDGKETQAFIHDLAGWLMMPMGLLLLFAELWYLSRAIVEEEKAGPVLVGV